MQHFHEVFEHIFKFWFIQAIEQNGRSYLVCHIIRSQELQFSYPVID